MSGYEKPELLELGLLTMNTLSSTASAGENGVSKGDDNGENTNPGGN